MLLAVTGLLLAGAATAKHHSSAPPSFTVDEILVFTGDGGEWSKGTEFGEQYIHYRFGCADGKVIGTGGRDVRDLPMEVYGNQMQPFNWDFISIYGAYLSGNYGGWRPLPVNLTERADVDTVIPQSYENTFEGCSEPSFIEILYFSTNGWQLNGLTVLAGGKYKTFAPETAWPRLVAPFDDYDSVFLDLDGNFSDYYLASDPLARLYLVDTCDAVAQVTTGNSGQWSPGEDGNLHYKLIFGSGTDTSFAALRPARGPPPGAGKKWEPAHRPYDDTLTHSIYGGLVSRGDLDYRHLDPLNIDSAGATTMWRDRVAWECPDANPSHVDLIYGPSSDGWEMTMFEIALQPSTKETPSAPKKWLRADLSTEYPKIYATYDTDKAVFFDYNANCVPENWGDTDGPSTYWVCQSDWYMRFALTEPSHKSKKKDDETDPVTVAVLCTLFVTLFVVFAAFFAVHRYGIPQVGVLPGSIMPSSRKGAASSYSNLGAELMGSSETSGMPAPSSGFA